MLKVINCIVCIVFLLAFASCKKNLGGADFVSYVLNRDNGLQNKIAVDGFEFCIQYRPYDYIILLETRGNFKGYNLEKRKSDLKGTAWFSLTIRRVDNIITPLRYGISSIEEYNKRLNYYLNEAKYDLWMMYDMDSILPVSYLFENNYHLTPQETMIIGFMLPKGKEFPDKDMQFAYNDRVFKTGIIKSTITEKALNKIPNLVYKN